MSEQSKITLSYQDNSALSDKDEIWVRLEQIEYPEISQVMNFYDAYQMLIMASFDVSALWYMQGGCPLSIDNGVISVFLDFYAWPSSMDLSFQLITSLGELGDRVRVEEEREFDLIINNQDRVTLPYVVSNVEWEWDSRAISPDGVEISKPDITVDGSVFVLSRPCFGVLRVKCVAHGYLNTVTLQFVKEEESEDEDGNINITGYRIENIQCTETAVWTNENGEQEEDVLDLEIPACVEDYLSTCEDGSLTTTIIDLTNGRKQFVYINSCTGEVIDVFTESIS